MSALHAQRATTGIPLELVTNTFESSRNLLHLEEDIATSPRRQYILEILAQSSIITTPFGRKFLSQVIGGSFLVKCDGTSKVDTFDAEELLCFGQNSTTPYARKTRLQTEINK